MWPVLTEGELMHARYDTLSEYVWKQDSQNTSIVRIGRNDEGELGLYLHRAGASGEQLYAILSMETARFTPETQAKVQNEAVVTIWKSVSTPNGFRARQLEVLKSHRNWLRVRHYVNSFYPGTNIGIPE